MAFILSALMVQMVWALYLFSRKSFLSEISGHDDRIPAMDEDVRAVCRQK